MPAGTAVVTCDDNSTEDIQVNDETFPLDGYNPAKTGKQNVGGNENLTLSGNINVNGNEKSSIKPETDKAGRTSAAGFNNVKQRDKAKESPDTSDRGVNTSLITLLVSMTVTGAVLIMKIRKV